MISVMCTCLSIAGLVTPFPYSRLFCLLWKVLRVLSQRFPHEVDKEVAKLSRSLSKSKASAAAALAAADDEDHLEGDVAKEARREAFREGVLSSLLVSAFSGAGMVSHLPLEQENEVKFEVNLPLDNALNADVNPLRC